MYRIIEYLFFNICYIIPIVLKTIVSRTDAYRTVKLLNQREEVVYNNALFRRHYMYISMYTALFHWVGAVTFNFQKDILHYSI